MPNVDGYVLNKTVKEIWKDGGDETNQVVIGKNANLVIIKRIKYNRFYKNLTGGFAWAVI